MGVSGNTSPIGSPSNQQTSALSPSSTSISSTLSSVPTPGTFSRTDSGATLPHHMGSSAPVVMSVVPGGLMSVPMVTSSNNPQASSGDLMFGECYTNKEFFWGWSTQWILYCINTVASVCSK